MSDERKPERPTGILLDVLEKLRGTFTQRDPNRAPSAYKCHIATATPSLTALGVPYNSQNKAVVISLNSSNELVFARGDSALCNAQIHLYVPGRCTATITIG